MKNSAFFRKIDLKLGLLLAGFYTLFNVVYLIKIAYLRSVLPHRMTPETWYDLLVRNILIDWIVVIAYMTLIAISTKRLLNRNYPWWKIISLHTVLSILIGFIIRLIFDVYGILSGQFTVSDYELQESFNRFMSVIDLNFLIYFAMVFIIYTYYYLRQVRETEAQRNLLETQLVNTKMKMLSSQLQPHFLFNTLNSISVLADLDPAKAKDTIADLSDFLREILYSGDASEITLEKELRTLEYYLNILNIRFSNDLKIKRDIDERLLQEQVPALLLQPIIENSIKHGYSYDHPELEVLIAVSKKDGFIEIRVENNGAPLEGDPAILMQKGVGLANTRDRLKNLYGDNFTFVLQNIDGRIGVETVVRIPLKNRLS